MVLFIITSFWSIGELNIAIEFANDLKLKGIRSLFLAPGMHKKRIDDASFEYKRLIFKAKNLNKTIMKEIEQVFKPDYVLLSDFLNYAYCHKHYGITINDLEIFSGKVAAIDLYDIEINKNNVDAYGYRMREFKRLSLDCFDLVIQPCPILDISQKRNDARKKRCRLFNHISTRTKLRRAEAKNHFGLSHKNPVVLIASAFWQNVADKSDKIKRFVAACEKAFERTLIGLDDRIQLVSIGKSTQYSNELESRVIRLDSLPQDEFRTLSNASDLFISNNAISTAMAETVLAGIPTVLLENSILINEKTRTWINNNSKMIPESVTQLIYAYPFRLYPVGWYKFLSSIVSKNQYYELMQVSELFDKETIICNIEHNLFGIHKRDLSNVENYKKSLCELPQIGEVLY